MVCQTRQYVSNVASASDTESSDGFEVARTSTDTPSRISMTMMVFTFVCGILIGWMMRLLVPQHVEDDEPNVQSNNTTSVVCEQRPSADASVSDWLSTLHVTLIEVGWERVTTWMFMIAITLRMLFCTCFSRPVSLEPGCTPAGTATPQVASKGVSANIPRGPVQTGNHGVLPGAVHVTKTGKHYHHESCTHVRNGVSKRYTPCSFCGNEFLDG